MRSRRIPRLVRAAAVVLTIGSAIAFVAVLVLGSFVLDKFDAYGEVPIPGTAKVHLPAGRVTVSFHTKIVGSANGGGLPVPHLVLDIDPPAGVDDPRVSENVGGSTSVNSDIHRRVWEVQIVTAGDYIITTNGEVNGFISPRMALGYDSSSGGTWMGVIAALFVAGLATTIASSVLASRAGRAVPKPHAPLGGEPVIVASDKGIRIEQLKTLAALRYSGALTEKEFQAEKRRVLDGN